MILSIDTSTRGTSVALHRSGILVSSFQVMQDKSSSELTTTLIENAVDYAGCQLQDVDAIAVAKGPGSYTGLRVAVSTAKGLAYALDKPLIGVHTLKAMARQVAPFFLPDTLFCPMIDARRMEVFCAVYDSVGTEVMPTKAEIVTEASFAGLLESRQVFFFGDGADKCRALLGLQGNAFFLSQLIVPDARTVGAIASELFALGHFEDLESFEPYYLKDFVGTVPKASLPGN